MLLQLLQPLHARTTPKRRVGRGGKRGNTSGRGQKGQKSRSGHRIRPAERDLIIRLPKLRGYNNKPLSAASLVLNLDDLERLSQTNVNRETLLAAGFVTARTKIIKLLGRGDLKRAYAVSGIKVSVGAKVAIEKSGGRVTIDK